MHEFGYTCNALAVGTIYAGYPLTVAILPVTYYTVLEDYTRNARWAAELRHYNPDVRFWSLIHHGVRPHNAGAPLGILPEGVNGPFMHFPSQFSPYTKADLLNKGWLFHGNTIASLAAQLRANGANFTTARLVEVFQHYHPDFTYAANGLDVGDFYAINFYLSRVSTFGGINIDINSRVLHADTNQPIPGLWAAGDTANGQLFFREYYGSGTALAMGMVFGYFAGENAAARVPR